VKIKVKNNFNTYLIYLFIILVIFLFVVLLAKNRTKKKHTQKTKIQLINNGTIGVFFDKEKNVTIIPYVKDKYGMGRATGDLILLNSPYSEKSLGQSVRQAMLLSKEGNPGKDEELIPKLGTKSWKEFSEGKRNISVHFKEGYGIVFNTTRRISDGSYQFNHFGFEKTVNNDINDKDLGIILIQLLQRCR
jgi:hypothetical protein